VSDIKQLFDNNRVDILSAYDGEIRAGVEDNGLRYKVKIRWDDRAWSATCSCGIYSASDRAAARDRRGPRR